MKKPDFLAQRQGMVEYQLARRDIRDERVLEAFRKVPRHMFVKDEYKTHSYADNPLPIGCGQTISQPYMVALMTQLLELKGDEKVLEVGTGSGYQAAILAELAREVYTVERYPFLAERAEKILKELDYKNVHIKVGDGTLGWKEFAPYDRIIVTAAPPKVPKPLKEQLADGGRLVIPVGDRFVQRLIIIRREGKKFVTEEGCGCVFVPLVGKYGWRG